MSLYGFLKVFKKLIYLFANLLQLIPAIGDLRILKSLQSRYN